MWAVRWGVLFAGVSLAYCRQAYSAYLYPGEREAEREYTEYDEEGGGQTTMPKLSVAAIVDPLARMRRYGTQPTRTPDTTADDYTDQAPTVTEIYGTQPTRTPGQGRLADIKGAIKDILAGRNINFDPTTWPDSETTAENNFTDIYDYMLKMQSGRGLDERTDAGDSWTTAAGEAPPHTTTINRSIEYDYINLARQQGPSTTTPTTTTTQQQQSATTKPTSTTMVFNIDALLDIIANLTYEYEMDLVKDFNETLIKYSVPTCPTPTTTEITTTTSQARFPIENHPVVAKCFVCGLDIPAIPQNAYCADAFAGDFIPLVPVDPSAKGQIARYRKYCRYMDVNNYKTDRREPRSLLGRWTGGCSVRWTDLSGVYTQRTCRNKRHATTGLHFGSKRMAKLEMTLADVRNGCIISPMASLLPLSRGISLFARFHACVCTGSWCNRALDTRHWTPNYSILTIWLMSQIYA